MLKDTIHIIKKVAEKTDKILLFHSAAGKDSIALLDLCSPYFKEVVCVYMYIVKDLRHINKYLAWSKLKYNNCRFIQYPHYALYSYIKYGHYGIKQDQSQKLFRLAEINDMARENTGIEWTIFGFKQSDSLNRRIMLRTYEDEAINEASKKAYPLSSLKNKDVLAYIQTKNLIRPIAYDKKHQSQGTDITDINFLLWCRSNYPDDLHRVINVFPLAQQKLFEYDYHTES